jgi:alpha/beta superfamily hydrolase
MEVGLSDARVSRLISIGTPVNKYDFSFLTACRKPILFVHGEQDEYGDVEKLRVLVAEVAQNADAQLVVVPGVGHFFDQGLDQLKQAIADWIVR